MVFLQHSSMAAMVGGSDHRSHGWGHTEIFMTDRWTQDDLDAMLEIVDALAETVNRIASHDPRVEGTKRAAKSIHERARIMYQRKGG